MIITHGKSLFGETEQLPRVVLLMVPSHLKKKKKKKKLIGLLLYFSNKINWCSHLNFWRVFIFEGKIFSELPKFIFMPRP